MAERKKAPGKSFRKGISLIEIVEMFPDDETAKAWFEEQRWGTAGAPTYCQLRGADAMLAREVPSMVGNTGKPAGKIDLVVATEQHDFRWFGLEIQAVYFSGPGMDDEFVRYVCDTDAEPLYPNGGAATGLAFVAIETARSAASGEGADTARVGIEGRGSRGRPILRLHRWPVR